MLDMDFPVFVDGQTLTHSELNDLRTFLDSQDHSLGRLIGFGVNCGLDVAIEGGDYVVSPGLAIDQLGRPIIVDKEMRLPLAADRTEFDWLGSGGGRTLVVQLEETLEEAPECDEEGCTRHASLIKRTPVLAIADGCLPASAFTVAGSELSGVNPITVSKTSKASNTGSALAGALRRVLGKRGFAAASLDKISGAVITPNDLPGAAAWKAAFLNRVYFATLELLRCEALTSLSCFRPTKTPGVALGCNSDGRWDCNRRHAWEPPPGLSTTLLGADCDDPCRYHRIRIQAMIDNFVLPAFPEPPDPPKPGGGGPYIICRHPVYKGYQPIREDWLRFHDPCIHWEVPPGVIKPFNPIFEFDPDVLVDWPREVLDIYEVYGGDIDPIDAGTIGIGGGLGADPREVELLMTDAIKKTAGEDFPVDIQVVTESAVSRVGGYEPAVEAGITDTIVLVEDAQGKVVATGRVPVNTTLNTVGPAIKETSTNAAVAVEKASEAAGAVVAMGSTVAELGVKTTELGGILAGTNGDNGLLGRLGDLESQVQVFGSGVTAGHLDAKVDGVVNELDAKMSDLKSEVQALVVEEQSRFRDEMALRWDRNDSRIDTVLIEGKFSGGKAGINSELLASLKGMSGALAANIDAGAVDARKALREAERSIARMEAADEIGADITVTRGGEIVSALEGLSAAARASGVSAGALRDVNRSIVRLRGTIG